MEENGVGGTLRKFDKNFWLTQKHTRIISYENHTTKQETIIRIYTIARKIDKEK